MKMMTLTLKPQQVGVAPEQVGVAPEQVGMAPEQVGVALEVHLLATIILLLQSQFQPGNILLIIFKVKP